MMGRSMVPQWALSMQRYAGQGMARPATAPLNDHLLQDCVGFTVLTSSIEYTDESCCHSLVSHPLLTIH